MATLTTGYLTGAVKWAIKRIQNLRNNHNEVPNGVYLLTGYKDVVAASYDVALDVIELFQFPPQTYLLGCSVVCNKDYDVGGTALRTDLVLTDANADSFTSAVGSAFVAAGQPQNDGLSIVSTDNTADIGQTITIIGTTTGADDVIVEDVVLNGTTEVDTVKTNWGWILAVKVSSALVGTLTIEEKSGSVDTITLAPGVLSKGVNTVTGFEADGSLLQYAGSGASTKVVGFKGTDRDGTVIYDSNPLSGTTPVYTNWGFQTLTEVYTGDVENTVTVVVTPSEHELVAASAAWTTVPPTPINFNGAALDNSEYGLEVSNRLLGVRIDTAPTTANTGTVRLTYKALVYHGVPSTIVP